MRRTLAAAAVGALVVAAVATARSASPVPGGIVELGRDSSVVVVGAEAGDALGTSVSRAGDVNADGHMDFIVGSAQAGDESAGRAYVLFGPLRSPLVDLADLGQQGFEIVGEEGDDHLGYSVADAGDVNRDGYADVIVGAPSASPNGRDSSGAAYVVLGGESSAPVMLDDLGARGFRIDGARESDYAGFSVAGAGDVNRDGLADVIVGAPALGRHQGYAAVVYGRSGHAPVDLAAATAASRIMGSLAESDFAGASVANVGEMNADGQPDLAVGAQAADVEDREDSGAIYVVFVPRQAPPLHPPPPPLRCLVPSVKGKTLARAKTMLKAELCGIGRISRVAAKAKAGIVVSQRPRAGTTLSPSAKVSLVVSRGPR